MLHRTMGVPLALTLLAAMFLVACGGGSSGGTSGENTANTLVLVDMSVAGYDGVPLNSVLEFEFSEDLDPDTVRADTIQIREGPNYGKQVAGYYQVNGKFVLFYPRLPVLPDLSDAGLAPGKPYRVTLPGIPKVATVRNYAGDRIRKKTEVNFQTALSGSDSVFVDNFIDPFPPQVVHMNPTDGAVEVPAASAITLTFNRRPLNPATVTNSNITLQMTHRKGVDIIPPRVIPGDPILEQTFESVVVVYQSKFPLADDATYRLSVNRRVQDLVGNDVVEFVSVFSVRDEPLRTDAVTLEFTAGDFIEYCDENNTTASWNEAVPNALAALFTAAGGNGTAGDLNSSSDRNFRPEDFPRGVGTEVTEDGIEYDVYNFRSITIQNGTTIRFSQSRTGANRSVKLVSLKPILVEGTLTVSGGKGEDGKKNSYSKTMVLARGGAGGPGGGDGSDNYAGTFTFTPPSMDGEDTERHGGGGKGGGEGTYRYSYSSGTYKYAYGYSWGGCGGGGGSREPGTKGSDGGYTWATYYNGKGGKGGLSTTQRGFPLNYERDPMEGGGGGGAGGMGYYDYAYQSGSYSYAYGYHNTAGGGGGGGGAIAVQSASTFEMASSGAILADGGNGGAYSASYAYTGGAGAGGGAGTVVARATSTASFATGATLSVKGGIGGPYIATYSYYYSGGTGGTGGDGYIRVEALEDENSPGKPLISGLTNANVTYNPVSTGVFAPKGGGAPSIGQTVWTNLGVFGPIMKRPSVEDIDATLHNDTMIIMVQMAVENAADLGKPNLDDMDITDQDGDGEYDDPYQNDGTLSEWVKLSDIETLNDNDYQFIRLRITFQLDPNQTADQPLPFLNYLSVPFMF